MLYWSWKQTETALYNYWFNVEFSKASRRCIVG